LEGDAGAVAWLAYGMSRKKRLWGFDDEERRGLAEATVGIQGNQSARGVLTSRGSWRVTRARWRGWLTG